MQNEQNLSIEHLRTLNLEFSAICMQESCIVNMDDSHQIELKGYNWKPQGKFQCCSKRGGGNNISS